MKKPIKICLVDIKIPYAPKGIIPLNLVILASYLLEHTTLTKKQIKIINASSDSSINRIIEFQPDIIGLSIVTPAYEQAKKFAAILKSKLRCVIVIGGHHITGIPSCFQQPFDVGVIGEGEGALTDLIQLVSNGIPLTPEVFKTIPNLVYRDKKNNIIINPMRALLKPEEIPSYHWSLQYPEEIAQYKTVVHNGQVQTVLNVPIFSARGCPYRCIFCARQILWKLGAGFRFIPLDRVVDDIEYLYKTYHVTSIEILDDTFAVSKERIRLLLAKLKQKKLIGKIVFSQIFVRANLIDEEFAEYLKQLGVCAVFMGVESGSPRILKLLKNGSLQVHHVKRAMQIFASVGIRVYGSFMLFAPTETNADIEKTFTLAEWFAKQPNAHDIGQNLTAPFPGTALWDMAVRSKKIDPLTIQWNRIVTSYHSLDIGSKVMFRNGRSIPQLNAYWKRMHDLVMAIHTRNQQLPGWKASEQTVDKFNQKRAVRLTMRRKIDRIREHPTIIFKLAFKFLVRKFLMKVVRKLSR